MLSADGPVLQFFHAEVTVLGHYLEGVVSHASALDGLLHEFLLLLLDLLPVEETATFLHVLLDQDDVLEVLIGTLVRVAQGFLDEG